MKRHAVSLVDSTLREGHQAPGVHFDDVDSVAIAQQLYETGIDCIEVGHPYASEQEFKRVVAVRNALPTADILAHARARIEDVDAVAKARSSWIGIFAGVNEYSQKFRLQKSLEEILKLVESSVRHAKSLGLGVRYTVEDASRTPPLDLFRAYSVALEAGADRLCFADSVGLHDPDSAKVAIAALRERFPDVPLEVHFHDDRGLAMANALAAVSVGATHVSCSVNGIGERSGITDTCATIANLSFLNLASSIKPENIMTLSHTVSSITDAWPDAWRPVVGSNSFTHKSKLHVTAASRNEHCYHWMEPQFLGRQAVLL